MNLLNTNAFRLTLLVLTAIGFVGCVHSDGNPGLSVGLTLHLPPPDMTGGSEAVPLAEGCERRCVVGCYDASTGRLAARKVVAAGETDSCVTISIGLDAGVYDIIAWSDYGKGLHDRFYDTSDLRSVDIISRSWSSDSPKDAAMGVIQAVEINADGSRSVDVTLSRPIARYRLISTDLESYSRLSEANPKKYPPIESLSVEVSYELYVPTSFNPVNNRPADSTSGLSYVFNPQKIADSEGDEALIASDIIFADDTESVASLTLTVRNADGNTISRKTGIRVSYRRNCETVVRGNFLTSGFGSIFIDTSWDEDIIIPI